MLIVVCLLILYTVFPIVCALATQFFLWYTSLRLLEKAYVEPLKSVVTVVLPFPQWGPARVSGW